MSAEGAALLCCPSIDVPRLQRSTCKVIRLLPGLTAGPPPLCEGLRTAGLSGLDPEYRKIRVLRQKLAKLGVRRGVAGGHVDRRIQLAAD